MRYLFDDWDEIAEAVRSSTKILLLLDYDGTTVPIQRTPQQARLDEETRHLLSELSSATRIVLGIISGRSINDIRSMVGLDGLVYVGNHGLEILLPGKPVERLYGKETLHRIHNVYKELKEQLSGTAGIIFEEKGPIIAIHYRTAPPGTGNMLLKTANNLISKNPGFAIKQGKMLIEIIPDMAFNKGLAVKWLLDNLFPGERPTVIFAGDDLTDEDAFVILGDRDISVYVGPQPNQFSAKYYLKDTAEVRQFIFKLNNLLSVF
ncbi:MAG: trehalose-phosphatase [Candidatus Brocadiales bacterium]